MTDSHNAALDMLQQQLKELDAVEKKTVTENLNTVGGTEQVHKWKARTVPLIAQHLGPAAAKLFVDTKPGPSFTNDLFEEFSDEVEVYRSAIRKLMKEAQSPGTKGGPA
ncbi:MAG: hypothetical protein ACREI9_04410 [Nitrospiraceae bacterium]